MAEGTATILTDASYHHDSGVGGYGYWAVSDRGRHGGGGHFKSIMTDANQCEMAAIINAIYIAYRLSIVLAGDKVLVQTDSQNAIRRFQQHPAGFENTRPDMDALYHSYRELIGQYDLTVEFRHVKAHTANQSKRSKANQMCDKRAKQAMRAAHEHYTTHGTLPTT